MDYDRTPQHDLDALSKRDPAAQDFDFDAEHDPERARRISNMLLRGQQRESNEQFASSGSYPGGATTMRARKGEHLELLGLAGLLSPTQDSKLPPDGSMCERTRGGLCFFDDIQRDHYLRHVGDRISDANTAYMDALQTIRVDELLRKAPQLGFLAELAINVIGIATGGLLKGAISHAIKEVNVQAAWRGLVDRSELQGSISRQSKVVSTIVSESLSIGKSSVKKRFQGATPQSQLKEAFIQQMKNAVPPMLDAIRSRVSGGDDLTILTAFFLFDPGVFNSSYCLGLVEEQMSRLEGQHLDQIGPIKVGLVPDAGATEVVRLHAFGKYRLAVIEFYERKPMGRSHGETWYTPSGYTFLNWVDDDLAAFATSAQEARNGAMKTIDVSSKHGLGDEVAAWANVVRQELRS